MGRNVIDAPSLRRERSCKGIAEPGISTSGRNQARNSKELDDLLRDTAQHQSRQSACAAPTQHDEVCAVCLCHRYDDLCRIADLTESLHAGHTFGTRTCLRRFHEISAALLK